MSDTVDETINLLFRYLVNEFYELKFRSEIFLFFIYTISIDSNRTLYGEFGPWTINTYTLYTKERTNPGAFRHATIRFLQTQISLTAASALAPGRHKCLISMVHVSIIGRYIYYIHAPTTPVTRKSNVELVFCDGLNRVKI